MFVVAPLFLIALLVWIERGAAAPPAARRDRGAASPSRLPLAIPFDASSA